MHPLTASGGEVLQAHMCSDEVMEMPAHPHFSSDEKHLLSLPRSGEPAQQEDSSETLTCVFPLDKDS